MNELLTVFLWERTIPGLTARKNFHTTSYLLNCNILNGSNLDSAVAYQIGNNQMK